jgi:DNA-binding transcriptional LysR family regulator
MMSSEPPSWVQLRAFNAVFKDGSISKAAQRLGLTQPAVTAQIRALERAHEVLLFERTGSGMRPTTLARRLYAETDGLDTIADVAADILGASRALETGELSIAVGAPNPAMALIAEYHRRFPGVRITTSFGNWGEVTAAIRERRCDVAIATEAPRDEDIVSTSFAAQRVVAVVAPAHPLADRPGPLPLSDIVKHPVIFRPSPSLTQQKLEAALSRAGLIVAPLVTLGTREALIEAVTQGIGIGFMFEQATNRREGLVRLAVLELSDIHREDVFCLAPYRRRRTVAALFDVAEEMGSV